MKIVLYQPQIPQNTGNIVRTCAVSGSDLILITPLGFSVTDRWLRRAGLDYWEGVNVQQRECLEQVIQEAQGNFYFYSSKVTKKYTEIAYGPDDLLIFGSETSGLPPYLNEKWADHFATIPMRKGARCLNLATSVGVVVYEASRQLGFNFT